MPYYRCLDNAYFAALFLTTLCEELKKEKSSNWTVFLCIFWALLELCGAMLVISLARNLI